MITFSLAKGRIEKSFYKLFEKLGIDTSFIKVDSRKLIFSNDKIRIILTKPVDVPSLVEFGIADFGIVGKDIILEENKDVSELLDLKIEYCKIVIAGKKNIKIEDIKSISTKYTNISKKYFENKGKDVEIIKLSGSVELGAVLNLSDVIIDIVDSGKTLEENKLKVIDVICESSARLISNNASLKTKYEEMKYWISIIEGVI